MVRKSKSTKVESTVVEAMKEAVAAEVANNNPQPNFTHTAIMNYYDETRMTYVHVEIPYDPKTNMAGQPHQETLGYGKDDAGSKFRIRAAQLNFV